jgi:hypothetical protein
MGMDSQRDMTPMPAVEAATPLFVLGGHRGGTTLVQRILNSYDGIIIWGEHEGALTPIAHAYFRGAQSSNLFLNVRDPATSDPRTDWQAWMGAVSSEGWDTAFRHLVQSLFQAPASAGLLAWGFKEIRYGATAGDRALDLLVRLFPEARVAFVVRNPFNMLASATARPGGPRSLQQITLVCLRIATRFRTFLDWHRSGRMRSYWIVYEELITARGDVHRLLADLGLTFGAAQDEVLAAEGRGRGSSFHDLHVNERWRHLPRTGLAVARHALAPIAGELGYPLPPVSPLHRVAAQVFWAARRRPGARVMRPTAPDAPL